MSVADSATRCQWVSLGEACATFVEAESGVQGSHHIRPLHWYVACRLVIEGGFRPDEIKPHPPFRVEDRKDGARLVYDESRADNAEATVFGGLKTKDIDVVVAKDGIGPCIAVSMKGSLNAFRNLTNRLEEAVGDCTNIHIAYPALVYGFLHVFRANRAGPIPANGAFLEPDAKSGHLRTADTAVTSAGEITDFIRNYAAAMARLTGRRDLRNDVSRYESIALLLLNPESPAGGVFDDYPSAGSPLRFDGFFRALLDQYDLRFVYSAPNLKSVTRRVFWAKDSPALGDPRMTDFVPRIED
jgi:hypothetical protein